MAQRESILPPLSNSIYIKIRQDFLELCGGDHCMASLLSYYEYKLNAIVSTIEERQLKNKSYLPSADDYFIECSPSFLSKALLGLFGRSKIIESNNKLHEQNFITVKTEKIGNEYKTTRIALNIEPIKKSLLTLFENKQPLIQIQTTPLFENEQPPYLNLNRINNTSLNKDKKDTPKQTSDIVLVEIEKSKDQKMIGFDSSEMSEDFQRYYSVALGFLKQVINTVKESGGTVKTLEESKIGTWVKPIRDLYVIDKVDSSSVKLVYHNLPKDEFWSKNILSASKLRKQFNTLIVQYASKSKSSYNNSKSIFG
jgi:hypothetical protein